MSDINDILSACKRGDRLAQKALYSRYKNKLFVLSLRYANNRSDAEDILQEGFIKIFRDLHQYRGKGSLEGWMRKVVLNVALQYVQKQRRLRMSLDLDIKGSLQSEAEDTSVDMDMVNRILHLMHKMPVGFRTVLNLFVMEGYSHQEIADKLDISVGTSKSQLNRAKKYLKQMVEKSLMQ